MSIYLPVKCLRDREDCESYSQIESNCGKSFICVGKHNGDMARLPQDIFTVCWKNEEIDEMSNWDQRDIIDTISVLSQALSAHENENNNDACEKLDRINATSL